MITNVDIEKLGSLIGYNNFSIQEFYNRRFDALVFQQRLPYSRKSRLCPGIPGFFEEKPGEIYINGALIHGSVVISVVDNGVGMSEQDCEELNKHLSTEYQFEDEHVGILNINQRAKLLFGDKYGVAIARRDGGGLMVTLVFPAET